jgi:hypothetical protein
MSSRKLVVGNISWEIPGPDSGYTLGASPFALVDQGTASSERYFPVFPWPVRQFSVDSPGEHAAF